jgi:N-acyl homoserine lactone hydrolase
VNCGATVTEKLVRECVTAPRRREGAGAPREHTRPAVPPLDGGREGASVKLHPLRCGWYLGAPEWFHPEGGPASAKKAFGLGVPEAEWLAVPIGSFLVEHPSAGAFLIDAGLHSSVADDPRESFGRWGTFLFKELKMRPEDALPAQLRERGLAAEDIELVVATHLHMDHTSGLPDLPNASLLVSELEWEVAHDPLAWLEGYARRHFDGRRALLLDFERDGSRFGPFERTVDLFGDGSVRLVHTPGHTAGHLSVILRLDDGEAFVAGDAVYTMRTLETGHPPWHVEDREGFASSLRAIQDYLRGRPGTPVIPGHDVDVWWQLGTVL